MVKIAVRGVSTRLVDGAAELTAAAGEPWDELVRQSVERGWAGLECLSGIPGLVGATPMQNVGAYGQEVSDSVSSVRVLDTSTGRIVAFANRACRFGYRDSLFRSGEPGRHVVLSVSYRLRPDGPATVRYADVEKALAPRGIARPTLADVRASVLAIRRSKSMVLDPHDENRRSCGSFFTNSDRRRRRPRRRRGARRRSGDAALDLARRPREALRRVADRARRVSPAA